MLPKSLHPPVGHVGKRIDGRDPFEVLRDVRSN
jgi:hypothetical protein